jgi:hypothetical protein
MQLDDDYDIDADFQGALSAVMNQANRIAVKEFSGRKPSEFPTGKSAFAGIAESPETSLMRPVQWQECKLERSTQVPV